MAPAAGRQVQGHVTKLLRQAASAGKCKQCWRHGHAGYDISVSFSTCTVHRAGGEGPQAPICPWRLAQVAVLCTAQFQDV